VDASSSLDGGSDLIATDASRADGARASRGLDDARLDGSDDSSPSDAGPLFRLGHKSCSCDLGQAAKGSPGLSLALLGAAFLWRRRRR
jgi:MYXO-CTERM domain-containing protein